MNKKNLLLLISLCLSFAFSVNAQEKKETKYKLLGFPYTYIGIGYESPLMFGDMYSVTKDHFHLGLSGNLRVGYRFSSIFGLELKGGYSAITASAAPYSNKFWLGADRMTYYDYTKIDGEEYSPYKEDGTFYGVWGDNKVGINAHRYKDVLVRTRQIQLGILGVFNMNRLFMHVPENVEQRVSLLLKPGLYLNHFTSTAYSKKTKKAITKTFSTPVNVGLGGDMALHIAITRHLGLELNTGIMWVANQEFDGIRTLKRAKDDFIASFGATLYWKFGKSPSVPEKKVIPVPIPTPPPAPVVVMAPKTFTNFVFTPFSPKLGVAKERAISERAMFTFKVNKWDLLPYLGNNQMYLNQIRNTYQKISLDPDITVKGIAIEGYASPEGPYAGNVMLSNNRAKSIANYLIKHYNFPQQIIKTHGNAEDWDGLKEALKTWDHPQKYRLERILKSPTSRESKKKEFKKCGAVYLAALKEIYPPLRRNECIFKFSIKAYDQKDLVKIFNNSPEKLSADEMVAVINRHPIYSDRFVNTVNKALEYYPKSELLIAYKAMTLLQQEKATEARAILLKATKTDYIYNLLGVAYAQLKNKEEAVKYFNLAIKAGNKDARENLSRFEKLEESNKEYTR